MSGEEEKKEEVAAVPTEEVAAEPKEKKPETEDDIKKVNKPDETVMKEKISVEEEKMAKLQERLSTIKEQLDKNDNSRPDANSELGKAKAKFNNAKAESRRLQQEKRNIYDQISAADELRQQQQDLVTRLKTELQVFSVDEIERKIKQLEHTQQTTSLTVKEDKAIMEEIKKLSAGKPKIQSFKEAQDSLTGIKEHHNTLYVSLKAKSAELTAAKELEEAERTVLEAIRTKEDSKKPDMPKLFKERDELRKTVNEHRDAIRKIQSEFNEERKAWYAYQKAVRDIKQKEYLERKAAKQAEWDAWKKQQEEEEAKRDPWEEEKFVCTTLMTWVTSLLPKEEKVVAAVETAHPDGKQPLKKADLDSEDPFAGLGKKKGKNKKKGIPAAVADAGKSTKLKLSFEDLAVWKKLNLEAPMETSQLPAKLAELKEKEAWLATAPPKPKKEKKEEKKEEEKDGEEKKGKKGKKGEKKEEEKEGEEKKEEKKEEAAAGGDIVYADALKQHLVKALNELLEAKPEDPFKELYKILFAASLTDGTPPDVKPVEQDDAMKEYATKFDLETHMTNVVGTKGKGSGPAEGIKFMLSDSGDYFTDLSKKLKAAGGKAMSAEELKAMDAAAAKAKREKEAKEQAERDVKDAENAAKVAAMEAEGKKTTGGLHKFDASEVDQNGGDATADDFMDAFGF